MIIKLLFGIFLFLSAAVFADGKKALIVGDTIRIREIPNGKYVGVLYNNMTVEVLENSKLTLEIEGKKYPWVKIKSDAGTGWVADKFLNHQVPAGPVDTYDSPGDMAWFTEKYGTATTHESQQPIGFTVDSFTIDQYRNITKAANNLDETAVYVLAKTLYPLFKENPSNTKFEYFRKKLYDKAFIEKILPSPFSREIIHSLSIKSMGMEFFVKLVKNNEIPSSKYPSELWEKKDFVLAILEFDPCALQLASETLKADKDVVKKAVSTDFRSLEYASEVARKDQKILEAVSRVNKRVDYCQSFQIQQF